LVLGRWELGVNRIVVGLVDSPAARAALRWAARQASATGSLIEVVTCIEPLPCYVWSDLVMSCAPPPFTLGGLREDAELLQQRVLRQEFGARFGVVPIRASVVVGGPAAGIARSAAGADLIAVGRSRRRRRWHRSVGEQCSRLFDGPVVVVPPDHRFGGHSTSVPDAVRTVSLPLATRR
jgi:nucleotide-binding universal stress UspA family protein